MICPEDYFMPSMYCDELKKSLQIKGIMEKVYVDEPFLPPTRQPLFPLVEAVAELITLHFVQRNANVLRFYDIKTGNIIRANPILVRPRAQPDQINRLPFSPWGARKVRSITNALLPFVDCSLWCIDASPAKLVPRGHQSYALAANVAALDGYSLCYPISDKPDSIADSAQKIARTLDMFQYPILSLGLHADNQVQNASQMILDRACSPVGGRPSVARESLEILDASYPNGKHGKTWKALAAEISEALPDGKTITGQTLSKAYKTRENSTKISSQTGKNLPVKT